MATNENRILTTHAGSLPRPPELAMLLARAYRGESVDGEELAQRIEAATDEVIAKQLEVGIDIGNDGEQARESFFTYVQHRMSGFGGGSGHRRIFRDVAEFPDYAERRRQQQASAGRVNLMKPPQAIGEIAYLDTAAIDAECERVSRATGDGGFVDGFLTAPSPGIIATAMNNRFYDTDDAYLDALAGALAVEYRRIVDAGLILQIDAPDLAMERHGSFSDHTTSDFLAFVDRVIDAINRVTVDLDPARIRLHVCWGNYDGPHNHDVELSDLLPHLARARVGGLLLSMANPRHANDFVELARRPLPANMSIATGVIDVTTNYVEHPEVVADRIIRTAEAVGDPSRILACTDCGFDTSAGFGLVATDVAWEKLRSLRAGADLASERLFGHR